METKSYWIKAQDVLNIINDEVDRSNEESISAEYAIYIAGLLAFEYALYKCYTGC